MKRSCSSDWQRLWAQRGGFLGGRAAFLTPTGISSPRDASSGGRAFRGLQRSKLAEPASREGRLAGTRLICTWLVASAGFGPFRILWGLSG